MTKRSASSLALTLSLLWTSTGGSVLTAVGIPHEGFIARAQTKKSSSKKSTQASTTGLDAKSLALSNKGEWGDVADRLQAQIATETTPSRNHGWLAFAYMFLNRCNELKDLAAKVAAMPANTQDPDLVKAIEILNQTCQQKYDEAAKIADSYKDTESKDVLLNMALAAVAARRGEKTAAADFVKRAINNAPDFGWGYRTLGFIYDRSLKSPNEAEVAYERALDVEPNFKEVRDLLSDLRLSENDFDGAIDVATAAIKTAPTDPNNYYRLSQIYTKQWRLREATQQLDKAIKLSPSSARYYRAKAAILRHQGNMNQAIAAQQKAVDLNTEPTAKAFELIELSALHEIAGDTIKAADTLRDAVTLAPSNTAAHQKLVALLSRQKRWDDLEKEFRRALVLQPKSEPLHLGLANALIKLNKLDAAIEELKEASNLEPNDPRPHRQLGSIYLEKKDFPSAAKAYTRALNINPGSVEDLVALGFSYAQNDDFMQAETALVTALALQQLTQTTGNRFDVMRSLAVLLLTEGRYSEATTNMEAVTSMTKSLPTHPVDSFLLAQSRALRDRSNSAMKDLGDAFEALSPAEKDEQRLALVDAYLKLKRPELAVEQMKTLPEAKLNEIAWLNMQARAARMTGNNDKAEEFANKAIAANSNDVEQRADAYTELAQAQLAKGNTSGAEQQARKALEIYSKSFVAHEVLGRVFLKKGDHARAIEAGKHALEINPYYTQAYLLTGDAYVVANKFDEAANHYKQAVQLYPALLDAHRALRDIYKKLAQKEDAQKEDEIIIQIEKRS